MRLLGGDSEAVEVAKAQLGPEHVQTLLAEAQAARLVKAQGGGEVALQGVVSRMTATLGAQSEHTRKYEGHVTKLTQLMPKRRCASQSAGVMLLPRMLLDRLAEVGFHGHGARRLRCSCHAEHRGAGGR